MLENRGDAGTETKKERELEMKPATEVTVNLFLVILTGHLTQYDVKQSRGKYWNPYALGHYMGAANNVSDDTKAFHERGDVEAMEALKTSLGQRFTDLTPVRAVVRKINAWIDDAKIPRYPTTKGGSK